MADLRSRMTRPAMRLPGCLPFLCLGLFLLGLPAVAAQSSASDQSGSMSAGQEMDMAHQHHVEPLPPPKFPQLGAPQAEAGSPVYALDELEARALKNNPTVRQAASEADAASGRREQSGLWPNPTVGYTGEEIRGGSFRGGEQGFFVEQSILLGGKLGAARKVFGHEIDQARAEVEEQRLRVSSNVRMLYYQALASQETLAMRRELAEIANEKAKYSRQLFNVGQKNETEVLEDEIAAAQADLDVVSAEGTRHRNMGELAAVVGDAQVAGGSLRGDLETGIPAVDEQQMLNSLLQESPAVRIAQSGVARAEAAVVQQRRQAIPDLFLRAGFQQNRELLESTGKPVGAQGFAEVGLQLKLFNRNQGNVKAGEAELQRAQLEVQRVQWVLRERAAVFLETYRTAQTVAELYRARMLPPARRAYELIYGKYGMLQASYPQVLASRQMLYRLEVEYIASLGRLWTSSVALENFLLTDGLEAPSRPSDMDHPVREINAPSFMGALGPEK